MSCHQIDLFLSIPQAYWAPLGFLSPTLPTRSTPSHPKSPLGSSGLIFSMLPVKTMSSYPEVLPTRRISLPSYGTPLSHAARDANSFHASSPHVSSRTSFHTYIQVGPSFSPHGISHPSILNFTVPEDRSANPQLTLAPMGPLSQALVLSHLSVSHILFDLTSLNQWVGITLHTIYRSLSSFQIFIFKCYQTRQCL